MPDLPRRLEVPAHYDAARRDTWTDAVARLTDSGGVFRADPAMIDAYVEAVASHSQATRILAQTSVMITRGDRAVENPAVAIQRRAADAMAKAARNLGLHRTPFATVSVAPPLDSPMGYGRWCEAHHRPECTHHRRRCGHPPGSPVPEGGCCHQRAVRGTPACYHHAGKPLAQAKADGQAALARIYSGRRMDIDPGGALLWELGYSAQLTAELRERVAELASAPGPDGEPGTGLFWGVTVERDRGDGITEVERKAGPHAILRALDAEREHLVRTAAAAHTAGALDAAEAREQASAQALVALIEAILAGLELTARQRDVLVPVVVPAAIRSWNPEGAAGG